MNGQSIHFPKMAMRTERGSRREQQEIEERSEKEEKREGREREKKGEKERMYSPDTRVNTFPKRLSPTA